MKKKIFGGIAVLAVAVVVAWNVNVKSRTDVISDVKLANVEALAQESSENCSDGIAKLGCKIWTVHYNSSGSWSCDTGGNYICDVY